MAATAPHAADQPHVSTATYLRIAALLGALLLAGVVLSRFPISPTVIAIVVLGLSTVKAVIVAAYYMHLKFDRRWLTFIAIFPLLIITLAVLLIFSSRLVHL